MRPISALFAFLLLLAACGGGTTPSTAADDGGTDATPTATEAAPDAGGNGSAEGECDPWTLEEVAAATGIEATDKLGTDMQGQFSCIYTDASGSAGASYVVSTSEAAIAPSALYDAVREGAEAVSGIGDQAQWRPEGTLYVMSGGNLYAVSVLGSELDDQQKQDASIDLARLLIDRFR